MSFFVSRQEVSAIQELDPGMGSLSAWNLLRRAPSISKPGHNLLLSGADGKDVLGAMEWFVAMNLSKGGSATILPFGGKWATWFHRHPNVDSDFSGGLIVTARQYAEAIKSVPLGIPGKPRIVALETLDTLTCLDVYGYSLLERYQAVSHLMRLLDDPNTCVLGHVDYPGPHNLNPGLKISFRNRMVVSYRNDDQLTKMFGTQGARRNSLYWGLDRGLSLFQRYGRQPKLVKIPQESLFHYGAVGGVEALRGVGDEEINRRATKVKEPIFSNTMMT